MADAGGMYGLDAGEMTKIITATDDAHSRMTQLNSRVEQTAMQVQMANQSDSGRLQVQKFQTWRQDFNTISTRLQELNQKVKDLLRTGQSTSDSATDHAGR
ncbi:hypothetical protein ACWEV3_25135 [Saccharopolyspora sp. NPDC003752]